MFEHRPFGNHLQLTIRGASHARSLEFSLTGFPSGMTVDSASLAKFMQRRAPGRDAMSTARRESDAIEFVTGLKHGITTGAAIVGRIANADCRPRDYGTGRTIPRPGHADFGQWIEYGIIPSGGGANSGRLTAAICGVGALCQQWLKTQGISVKAKIASIGEVDAANSPRSKLEAAILKAKAEGDSVGGCVRCEISGTPPGIGGALFAGIESELAAAVFAIPGVKGIEFGNGFAAASLRGSENNDAFAVGANGVHTRTNRHGGILGGRTTGMPIEFRVAMKPTPTIFKAQRSVELTAMRPAECVMRGRHDPCIVRRAVPVVEAVAAFVIADQLLARAAVLPRICLTLTGKTIAEALAQYRSQRYFCEMVELRADLLSPSERRRVNEFPASVPVPVILTFRRKSDSRPTGCAGRSAFRQSDEAQRIRFFKTALRAAKPFAYVDFEDDFRVSELEELARQRGTRIIRSLHAFDGPIRNVARRCREMIRGTDEIAKLAFMPKSLADVARLFRETSTFADVPHVVCAMGALGLASRVLAVRTHSLWTYTSLGGLDGLGHLSPQTLVSTYRFRTLTRDTRLYGVTGFPLPATRSPEINNAAWLSDDRDAVMVPFPARTAHEALAFMKAMGMAGMAVTIPHKREILPLLDQVERGAKKIGAVNTVALESGHCVGYNTDVAGFAEALGAFIGSIDPSLRCAVLGDGGAAQAVKAALKSLRIPFEVFHRQTPTPGFGLIVNATPVDPIPDYRFSGRELVYDLGYVPAVTPLLARAQAAGCRTENGFSMLTAQAREQRRLWQA